MKRKIKKGRSAAIVTLGLAAVSLVSVGFSAWIIQTATMEETTEITVNVADVNNQTINITDVALTDSTFEFDALKTDNQGEIIWGKDTANPDDDAGEDLTWGFEFSLTPNGKPFQGISLGSTSSDVTEQNPTSAFVAYDDGTIIDIPSTFVTDTYLPLVPNDALDDMQAGETTNIYLDVDVNTSTVLKVESSSNYDISVEITATNVGDQQNVVLSYHFEVEMKAKWGSKYLGVNPCLCDGADTNVNQVFEDAEKTLPTVESIMTDLTNLNTELNGKQIKHIIRHDPASPVIIQTKQ